MTCECESMCVYIYIYIYWLRPANAKPLLRHRVYTALYLGYRDVMFLNSLLLFVKLQALLQRKTPEWARSLKNVLKHDNYKNENERVPKKDTTFNPTMHIWRACMYACYAHGMINAWGVCMCSHTMEANEKDTIFIIIPCRHMRIAPPLLE